MTTDTDRIEEPTRQYLLTSGGDGFSSEIVSGAELNEAFIKLLYDPTDDCLEGERKEILEHLHDEDNWETNHELGPVRFEQRYEDGYIAVTLITALSAELVELRQAKESLDWLLEYAPFTMRDAISSACMNSQRLPPPYLKSRLEGKK